MFYFSVISRDFISESMLELILVVSLGLQSYTIIYSLMETFPYTEKPISGCAVRWLAKGSLKECTFMNKQAQTNKF